jgi:hypothetical protein
MTRGRLMGMSAAPLIAIAVLVSNNVFAEPSPPSDSDMMLGFLVQSVCLGADGKPTGQIPIDPSCTNTRPMTEDDPVLWRKHDWGGANGPIAGWQASDAVLARRRNVLFVAQTFDFGAPSTEAEGHPDVFYRFDPNDGGDAIVIVGDTASAFLTQDGGSPGLQWFTGRACDGAGLGRYVAWVLFKSDADKDWRSTIAQLSRSSDDSCAWWWGFSQAFTRYKLAPETFPFQMVDAGAAPTRQSVALSTIVSEHFNAPTMIASHSMERFYYAKGLGKVRWEAWSSNSAASSRSAALQQSGRCAPIADSGPPDAGWFMIDCRMWTNIVVDRQRPQWRVRDFNWPPADLVLKQ